MKFFLKHRVAITLLVAIAIPVFMQIAFSGVALAQCAHPDGNGICSVPSGISTSKQLIDKITEVINLIFTALLLLAVVFIILAAFSYLTAGGDAEKVKTASRQVLYAAVAVGVAVLARAIPLVVQAFLG